MQTTNLLLDQGCPKCSQEDKGAAGTFHVARGFGFRLFCTRSAKVWITLLCRSSDGFLLLQTFPQRGVRFALMCWERIWARMPSQRSVSAAKPTILVVLNRGGGASINFQGGASPYVLYNMESLPLHVICFSSGQCSLLENSTLSKCLFCCALSACNSATM